MRDFSDDLKALRAPSRRGRRLPARSTTPRARLAELETEVARARPLGRPGPGQAGQRRVRQRARRPRRVRRPGRRDRRRRGARTSSPARRATRAQEPEIEQRPPPSVDRSSTSSSCAACSPASTTSADAICADQRQGRRRRRPGLGRDAAAHVHRAGPSGAASTSRSTTSRRAPRPASCRPSSRSRAATPTG